MGGGKSVTQSLLDGLKGRAIIAVNSSYIGVPKGTPIVFHDRRWLAWHAKALATWTGPIFTSSPNVPPSYQNRVHFLNKLKGGDPDSYPCFMTEQPDSVAARDSGGIAVNVAFHTGAKRIILLGFDMGFEKEGDAHWYPEHPVPARVSNYQNRFLPQYPLIAEWLRQRNVPLLTLTETAIKAKHVPRTSFAKLDAKEEAECDVPT